MKKTNNMYEKLGIVPTTRNIQYVYALYGLLFLAQYSVKAQVVHPHTGNLYLMSDAQSRSISPEHLTGEKGKGGMIKLEDGTAKHAARELGTGWKVNPYLFLNAGETLTLAEIEDSGVINHIWITLPGNYRHSILRMYWDDEKHPSVEVPIADFFATPVLHVGNENLWGSGYELKINSAMINVNPRNGFNSFWQMPFRKKCRITLENASDKKISVYYQVDYTLQEIPENAAYFHAQFRRVKKLKEKEVYTMIDNVKGQGHYVGAYVLHGSRSPLWWGEGEIKFYIDGDTDYPTINGTGEEDYFCGSYGYKPLDTEGKELAYENYNTLYNGFYKVPGHDVFGQYRWHVLDPIRFKNDLKVTLQSLGWKDNGAYLSLQDDLASVVYWYQAEPHMPFPALPSKEELDMISHQDEFKDKEEEKQ